MSHAELRALQSFEITNQQRIKRIKIKNIREVLNRILPLLGMPYAKVSILFCDNKFIRKLNRKFFNESGVTDVISFPLKDATYPQYLGEVIICVEEAKKAAKLYGNTWQEELVFYLIHGILHLMGYNDIKNKQKIIMERKQEEILSKILKKHKKIVNNIGK